VHPQELARQLEYAAIREGDLEATGRLVQLDLGGDRRLGQGHGNGALSTSVI
jgi:hypothetical protein